MYLHPDDVKLTIRRAAELTGRTEKAIRAKIERGEWPEGVVWERAPDGRITVILGGYNRWVAGQACVPLAGESRSTSATRGSAVESG